MLNSLQTSPNTIIAPILDNSAPPLQMLDQEVDSSPQKRVRAEEPLIVPLVLREQIVTPIAFKMLELLRTITHTVIPNLPYLNTGSVVNQFRLEKIHHKLEKIELKISTYPDQERLTSIKNILDRFRPLLSIQAQSMAAHINLADEIIKEIQIETNNVRKISDFPENPFLVCLVRPPSSSSSLYVSPAKLEVARRVYRLFLKNVKIKATEEGKTEIAALMKYIIGDFAHNEVVMGAFNKIFKKNKINLSIEEGSIFRYLKIKKNRRIIEINNRNFLSIAAKSRTEIEFQLQISPCIALFHELLHHIVYFFKEPIPVDPLLDTAIWTNSEEKRVIEGSCPTDPLSENHYRKILGLFFRSRHTSLPCSLNTNINVGEFKQLINYYTINENFTSLLDLEYRADILPQYKPKSLYYRILQIEIIDKAPLPLKTQFITLGYQQTLSYLQQIEEYNLYITLNMQPILMYKMLKKFPIPKEVFPNLFTSFWINDKQVQEKLLATPDLQEEYKIILNQKIIEQSTHPTLELLT